MNICRYADKQSPGEDHVYESLHHFDCPQIRIVLLGKTGVGKSAVGNTILGRTEFESALKNVSVTHRCQKEYCDISNRHVAVIDTPGLFDTDQPSEEIQKEIVRCIQVSSPGPHAFLVVMQLNRFTKEEKMCVEALQEIFGEEANKFMIILFTRGDDLQKLTIHDFVRDAHPDLKGVIRKCGGRYHVFNNSDSSNRDQVNQLLDMIERMMAMNGENFYTQEMYREVETKIREKEEEIKVTKAKGKGKISKEERLKRRLENAQTLARELGAVVEAEIDKKVNAFKEEIQESQEQSQKKTQSDSHKKTQSDSHKKTQSDSHKKTQSDSHKKTQSDSHKKTQSNSHKKTQSDSHKKTQKKTRRKAEESDLDLSFAQRLKQKVARAFGISKQ